MRGSPAELSPDQNARQPDLDVHALTVSILNRTPETTPSTKSASYFNDSPNTSLSSGSDHISIDTPRTSLSSASDYPPNHALEASSSTSRGPVPDANIERNIKEWLHGVHLARKPLKVDTAWLGANLLRSKTMYQNLKDRVEKSTQELEAQLQGIEGHMKKLEGAKKDLVHLQARNQIYGNIITQLNTEMRGLTADTSAALSRNIEPIRRLEDATQRLLRDFSDLAQIAPDQPVVRHPTQHFHINSPRPYERQSANRERCRSAVVGEIGKFFKKTLLELTLRGIRWTSKTFCLEWKTGEGATSLEANCAAPAGVH